MSMMEDIEALTTKVTTLERVIGQLGQTVEALAQFFDGSDTELAQSIYNVTITQAALIEHLECDEEIKTIIIRLEQEATERATRNKLLQAEKAKEVAEIKAQEALVNEANERIRHQEPQSATAEVEQATS